MTACAVCGHELYQHSPSRCLVPGCLCLATPDQRLRRTDPGFAGTHARRADPDTSHAAAELAAGSAKREAMTARLLAAFMAATAATGEEAAKAAGYTATDGAWKRVSDLIADGLIADTGGRVLGSHGRLVRVLRITDAGVAAYRKAHGR